MHPEAAPGQIPIEKVVVTTAEAREEPVPLTVSVDTVVRAPAQAVLTTPFAGYVAAVHVADGDAVTAGAVLVTLKNRQAEAEAALAEAAVIRAQAELDAANMAMADVLDVLRDRERLPPTVIPSLLRREASPDGAALKELIVQTSARIETAGRTLSRAQEKLAEAEIPLRDSMVRAPFDGTLGILPVRSGDTVAGGDNIAVVTREGPGEALIRLPQRYAAAVGRTRAKGEISVSAAVEDDAASTVRGVVAAVDSRIDSSSASITLLARFPFPDEGSLWPGTRIRVAVTLDGDEKALTVPETAVRRSGDEAWVFVIRPDATAERRPVTVSRVHDGNAVIASGLKAGEAVATDALSRLRPGLHVVPRVVQ